MVDNDAFALEGLEVLLDREEDLHVIWTSQSPGETVSRCLAPGTRPDVLLVDMSLGEDESGSSVCRVIRKAMKAVPMLAMTAFPLHCYLKEAAFAGAQGIVSKADRDGMMRAIRTVAAGGTWGEKFDTTTIAHIRLLRQPTRRLLTEREATVLNLAATGLTVRGIALRMGVGDSTVKTLIARAKPKLGASSLREAVATWTGERNV